MSITIAVDAMGSDHGPKVAVSAAQAVLEKFPELRLILVGQQEVLEPLLPKGELASRLEIQHASEVITMEESVAVALRTKRDSSMRVAIKLVKEGRAQACVSAGNTGALMATARFILKTLPGIDRPAIMAVLPTRSGRPVRILDLGANVDSTAEQLYQFAVMGAIAVSAVTGDSKPRLAILNIGEEEIKGNEIVKKTAELVSQNSSINYIGYVEGDDVLKGDVDIVVCDGFVGNVLLKSCEGTSKLIAQLIKEEFMRSWWTRLIGFISHPVLSRLRLR
jgi:glycerol-3-phosphate acyltransferase PlsX